MTDKDPSEFPPSKVNKDGLYSYCRACAREYNRARLRGVPRTDEQKAKARHHIRRYRYGLGREQYEALLEAQNNACAVCKEPFTEVIKPNVDHDHKCCPGVVTCGKCVRGLLCSGCNAFAGMIETRFATHEDMFTYLHLHHNLRWGSIKSDRAMSEKSEV